MSKSELDTVIYLEDGVRLSIDEHDDGVWLHISTRHGTTYVVLPREDAEAAVAAMQRVLKVPA